MQTGHRRMLLLRFDEKRQLALTVCVCVCVCECAGGKGFRKIGCQAQQDTSLS